MYLELANNGIPGYTFVPFNDTTSQGGWVRNDVLRRAQEQAGMNESNEDEELLSDFFGSIWNGIKGAVGGAVGSYIGGQPQPGQPQTQQPPIIIQPSPLGPPNPYAQPAETKILGMPLPVALGLGVLGAIFLPKLLKSRR